MKKQVTLFLFLFIFCKGFSMPGEKLPYQSEANNYYWKYRKPYEGYWQQDVAYTIHAKVDETLHIIDGSEQLLYTNNSPDTLSVVYFHLYQNAFQPGSYLENLKKNNRSKITWGAYEAQKLGTLVDQLKQDGQNLKSELDNTILKVFLNHPILPGKSTILEMNFTTHFDNGSIRRRMKKYNSGGSTAYNGVQFYPKISVYDKKFGWDTHQHLNREFYGDFGSFDVELDFASNYIVEATGELQNESEVLPDSLKRKLNLKNFASKPWNSKPSVIIPYELGKRKIWKYYAVNVHDFAFTANPNYRIDEVEWNNIKIIAIAQEQHAGYWQNAAAYGKRIVEQNSKDFGMYAYPKIVLADAEDGMEYPMLTLNRGYDPNYRNVFVHEVSHNWYYAIVGSNETYRACMDEGFSQFLTAWTLEALEGRYKTERTNRPYLKKFLLSDRIRYQRALRPFLLDELDRDTRQLNTHSDDFNGALDQGGGYREVYYKTATMLYNLQYVLGDSLFQKAMKNYYHQWKIAHPYPEDFRNSIISYTKVDLNWFFDEWMETTKTFDYKIKSAKRTKEKGKYILHFQRNDLGEMPLDFQVVDKQNKYYNFHVPNKWFVKETNATVLPKWYGWGKKLNPDYYAEIKIDGKLKDVRIDTTHRLADFNLLNNSLKLPVRWQFDHQLNNELNWEQYEVFWRPDIWYNGYDGLKIGLNLNGNYLDRLHVFDASIWYNSGFAQQKFKSFQRQFDLFSFRLAYFTALRKVAKDLNAYSEIRSLDGLYFGKFGLEKYFDSDRLRVYFYYKSLYRADSSDLNYLLYPGEWQIRKWNNTLNYGADWDYKMGKSTGKLKLALRNAAFTNDYAYSTAQLTATNRVSFWKFDIRSRIYLQYLTGNAVPDESALYLAGGNPEKMMDQKFVRSVGFVPDAWTGYGATTNHFQEAGGLNLRGYAGYTAVEMTKDLNQRRIYKGHSGAAFNLELSFVRLFPTPNWRLNRFLAMDLYLFGDAGSIDFENDAKRRVLSEIRMDAGAGGNLTIKKWGILDKPNPLTLRFELPLFLNRPPYEESEYIKLRWVLGIGKSF